ncbi:unnamed protein product [Paramecium primaurelia]|uniref:Uncharacterized protein n=1 Tax=Paramecium primaurelia TaxID=5886 RepID=A0A8S1LC23_PARPR|nr:unnamed protein product [Paramecium primaurelia]
MASERIHKYEESKDFIQKCKQKNCFSNSYGSPFCLVKKFNDHNILKESYNKMNVRGDEKCSLNDRLQKYRSQAQMALDKLETDYKYQKQLLIRQMQQKCQEEEEQMQHRIQVRMKKVQQQ